MALCRNCSNSVTCGRSAEETNSNPESAPATAATAISRTKRALPTNLRPPPCDSAGGVVTIGGSSTSRFMVVGAGFRIALKKHKQTWLDGWGLTRNNARQWHERSFRFPVSWYCLNDLGTL